MILKTTNSGNIWMIQDNESINSLWGVSTINANTATAVGEKGAIFRTTDGGKNWYNQSSGTDILLLSVYFIDENYGTIVGKGGTILKSTDGGKTWESHESGSSIWLYGVSFSDYDNGLVVGDKGTILRTTDGDNTWVKQASGTRNFLQSVSFIDSKNAVAAGAFGTILKTTDGGITFSENTISHSYNFQLYQDYPNPFNPVTTLTYTVPSYFSKKGYADISLKIYDILGKGIKSLVDEKQKPGDYSIQFNAINYASGIYLYKLQIGNLVQVKKMLLLK